MFDRGRQTRFDLNGYAVIHTAPIVKKVPASERCPAGYEPVCIGTATSDRMERFTQALMQQYGVRLIVGKGACAKARRRPLQRLIALVWPSSAAPPRWRRPGSNRSRTWTWTWTWTTSTPSRCGSSASRTSARCWWPWTAWAAAELAAQSLWHSDSALGAFYRRLWARMDKPRANTSTAHKLARMVYFMLTRGETFVDQGQQRYEAQQRQRSVTALKRRAAALGFTLAPAAASIAAPV